MKTATTNAAKWESAWAEYVESMEVLDATRRDRFRRGGRRAYGKAGTRYGRAVKALRKMDPEFCDRMGIE